MSSQFFQATFGSTAFCGVSNGIVPGMASDSKFSSCTTDQLDVNWGSMICVEKQHVIQNGIGNGIQMISKTQASDPKLSKHNLCDFNMGFGFISYVTSTTCQDMPSLNPCRQLSKSRQWQYRKQHAIVLHAIFLESVGEVPLQ